MVKGAGVEFKCKADFGFFCLPVGKSFMGAGQAKKEGEGSRMTETALIIEDYGQSLIVAFLPVCVF